MTIKTLNVKMRKWLYGYIANGKFKTEDFDNLDDWKDYRLLSLDAMERYHIGTCWDLTYYVSAYFDRYYPNIEYCCYYIQSDKGDTHTWLAYKEDNNIVIFEASWKQYAGLYRYNTEKEMLKDYLKKNIQYWIAEHGLDDIDYFIMKFEPFKQDGMKPIEYMYHILNEGKLITGDVNTYIHWLDKLRKEADAL